MREEKGITLIALTVTIVVLLILAGISLSLVLGNEGILKRATNAVDKTEKARIKEEIELAILDIQAEEIAKGNKVTLETLANGQLQEKIEADSELEEDTIIGEYKGYEYQIDNNLEVTIEEVKGIMFRYELNTKEYTKEDIEVFIKTSSKNGNITNIQIPELQETDDFIENEKGEYKIKVTKNGKYKVIITDSTGAQKIRTINIKNIDKIKPTITMEISDIGAASFKIIANGADKDDETGERQIAE